MLFPIIGPSQYRSQRGGEGGRGGYSPTHWPEKYAKYKQVFSAFEADFCAENENTPPTGLGSRSCEGLAVMKDLFLFGPDMWSFLFSGAHPKLVRRSD